MLVALNRIVRSNRRRLATLMALGTLFVGVLASHSAVRADHMGDGVTMCLAVLQIAAVGVGVAVLARRPHVGRVRWPSIAWNAPAVSPSSAPEPRTRAGPPFLQVFRL